MSSGTEDAGVWVGGQARNTKHTRSGLTDQHRARDQYRGRGDGYYRRGDGYDRRGDGCSRRGDGCYRRVMAVVVGRSDAKANGNAAYVCGSSRKHRSQDHRISRDISAAKLAPFNDWCIVDVCAADRA